MHNFFYHFELHLVIMMDLLCAMMCELVNIFLYISF
jgi:hypothetical protein